MTQHPDDVENRLSADGERWRQSVPEFVLDLERPTRIRRHPRVGLLAVAAVVLAVGVPATLVSLNDDSPGSSATPATSSPDPSPTAAALSPRNAKLAKRFAQRMQGSTRGTFVGALASEVVVAHAIPDTNCGARRLLRVRVVWDDDANFVHSGLPGGPSDGPLKAQLIYVVPDTGMICSLSTQYRSVGAAPDEVLLSGVRPDDPTGQFVDEAEGASRVDNECPVGRHPSAWTVQLNVMSGLPNPQWTLAQSEADELRSLLRSGRAGIIDSAEELGGFVVHAGPAQQEFLASVGLPNYFWVPDVANTPVRMFLARSLICHPEAMGDRAQVRQ